jgi:hypothetical protein
MRPDHSRPRPSTRPGDAPPIEIRFSIPARVAPALRSAIEEIRGEVGERLAGSHAFVKEQALTDASIGLAALAAAVNARVPAGDRHYE